MVRLSAAKAKNQRELLFSQRTNYANFALNFGTGQRLPQTIKQTPDPKSLRGVGNFSKFPTKNRVPRVPLTALVTAFGAEFGGGGVFMAALGAEPVLVGGTGRAAFRAEFTGVHFAASAGPA